MARLEGESIYRVPAHLWADPRMRERWTLVKAFDVVVEKGARSRLRWRFGRHKARLKLLVIERDGERCARCGKGNEFPGLHLDHVIPLARCGANEVWNLQLLCESCNAAKGSRLPALPEGLG